MAKKDKFWLFVQEDPDENTYKLLVDGVTAQEVEIAAKEYVEDHGIEVIPDETFVIFANPDVDPIKLGCAIESRVIEQDPEYDVTFDPGKLLRKRGKR